MSSSNQPLLDFKSATLYAVRLVLQSADTAALLPILEQRLQQAGDFFDGEPVVIDAQALNAPADWKILARALAAYNMPLVGVAAPEAMHSGIRKAGLAVVNLPAARGEAAATGSIHRDPTASTVPASLSSTTAPEMSAPAAASKGAPVPTKDVELLAQAGVADEAPASNAITSDDGIRPTLVLDRSLRSGQKVYARGADLIVIGMVSPGAEVLADGNIHVYGPLRGKAMAGARGDENARIFTTQLDAELVAVAGVYRVVETQLPADVLRRPAAVRLHDGVLRIEPLSA